MAKLADHPVQSDDQPVNYERPPVNEVYISMQTKKPIFPASDFGWLVRIFGTQFTKLNAHPKLDRMAEFPPGATPAIKVEMLSELGQRFWLISEDDTRVLQIQDDRVILNWRRQPDGEYPRYRTIRAEFEQALSRLLTELHAGSEDLFDFCEVSYTNQIKIPGVEDPRSSMHRIFRHIQHVDLGLEKLTLEESGFTLTFAIHDDRDRFVGRMRVITMPAVLLENKQLIFQTQLSFRGKPTDGTLVSALRFCDHGHISIVSAFDRMTTEEMHQVWGRR